MTWHFCPITQSLSSTTPATTCKHNEAWPALPSRVKLGMAQALLQAPPAFVYIAAQHLSEERALNEWEELVRDSEAMWNESQAGASRI